MKEEKETTAEKKREMSVRRSSVCITVVCMALLCTSIPISNLLDRASKHSDRLHSLSTSITQHMDSHFPLIGQLAMPRPSMCHTSSLQTPNDKAQALQVSEAELMSLVRSLLQSWAEPLSIMFTNANTLPQTHVSNKIQELREDSRNLGDGLDILSARMGPAAQMLSILPYRGTTEFGNDQMSKLLNVHFLLSCFRRDSHKIDSFLKVLRCRAAKMRPDMC